MDPPASPSLLHRHSSSASSRASISGIPRSHSHSRDPTEDGLPTRFRRGSSTSVSAAGLTREEIRERELLVNEYEAEEERLVNVLGRRMEEMRSETTHLHNAMEGETEALVNKLQRQVQGLQAQLAAQSPSLSATAVPVSPSVLPLSPLPPQGLPALGSPILPAGSLSGIMSGQDPLHPSPDKVLEVIKSENESLRNRLSDAERGYIHVCRQNDVYREELINLRQRLNLPYQDLIPPPASPSSSHYNSIPPSPKGLTQGGPTNLHRSFPSGSNPSRSPLLGATRPPQRPAGSHRTDSAGKEV